MRDCLSLFPDLIQFPFFMWNLGEEPYSYSELTDCIREEEQLLQMRSIFTFSLARRVATHCPFHFPLLRFNLRHEGAVHVGQPVEPDAAHRLQAKVLALPRSEAFWGEEASVVPHPRVQGLPPPHGGPLHARAPAHQHLLEAQVASCLPPDSTAVRTPTVLFQPCIPCVSAPGRMIDMMEGFGFGHLGTCECRVQATSACRGHATRDRPPVLGLFAGVATPLDRWPTE